MIPQNPNGTGVSSLDHSLSDISKFQICLILGSGKHPDFSPQVSRILIDQDNWASIEEHIYKIDRVREFLRSLDDSVSIYHAAINIAEDSLPSNVRENIRAIRYDASALLGRLTDLNVSTRIFIGEETCALIEKLSADCLTVHKLLSMPAKQINQYVSGGRPIEYSTLQMSTHVARAMRQKLEIAPKSTKTGLYLQILEVIFEAATGREPTALHDLARRALKLEASEYSSDGVFFEL